MPTWADVEDIMAYWHRQANAPAWWELEQTEEQLAALVRLANDRWTQELLARWELDIHDTLGICAAELRPEPRLRAADRSTRQSQGE